MPPVSRVGDMVSGHVSFPPTPAVAGSGDVFTNNISTHRKGDTVLPHASPSPSPPHSRATSAGSGTVFVNGKPITRIGDACDCGGSLMVGSGNVIAGG